MTVGLVAVRYPQAHQADKMVDGVRAAAEVLNRYLRLRGGDVLAGIGWRGRHDRKWESECLESLLRSGTAADVDFEYERESRPRDVSRIVGDVE